MAEFLGCTTQASGNHSSTLKQSNDDCEVFRQRFRHFQYQKTAGPREAFNNLWELCSNWLKPKMRSKDEILEQLVLEQFLCVLPMELQTWGKLYRSENRERILSLIEELQKELVVAEQQQNMLTFDDVIVNFSPSEWELLDPSQKQLYKEVMQDVYGSAISLGLKFKNDGPTFPFEQGSGNTSEEIPQEAAGIGNLYEAFSMEKHHEDGSGKLRRKCRLCNQELPKHMNLYKMDGSGDTPFE